MNVFENENSLNKNLQYFTQISSHKKLSFNLRLIHKIFNSINISLISLIFIFSFISFKSQTKWSTIYKDLARTRAKNNNLIDYISKTEEFYINQIESLNIFKKTTPKDLIYFDRQYNKKGENKLIKNIKYIQDGFRDSKYQRGY